MALPEHDDEREMDGEDDEEDGEDDDDEEGEDDDDEDEEVESKSDALQSDWKVLWQLGRGVADRGLGSCQRRNTS